MADIPILHNMIDTLLLMFKTYRYLYVHQASISQLTGTVCYVAFMEYDVAF